MWAALVDRYQRLVFSVAVRNGLGHDDAADVTQATFEALLDSVTALRSDERLASWLMTVARRHAWRLRRRRDQEHGLPMSAPEPGDAIADWERLAVVHDALNQLQPSCRELLVALYFDPTEPSYAEVAAQLGRAIGGIGPLRARCLERMRTLIGEEVST